MNREEKTAQVEEIADHLGEANAIFAIDYRGISVSQAAELRTQLSEAEASFRVVKNRLAKRAVEQVGTGGLEELLEGPTALTFVKGDAVTAAKAIATFARQHGILEYKGGLMDGAALGPDQFTAIARLPALDVLHGQLVGLTATPLTSLTRGLGSMLSGFAVALGQIQERGLVQGEAAEVPGAEEEPAAEEPTEAAAEEPAAEALPDAGDEGSAEEESGEEESGEEGEQSAAEDDE
jgi:large subunit ribosomal protein L10